MILEFLKIFAVGTVVGSIVVRMWFRLMVDADLLNVKVNLSTATNRKFRIIELIPLLGTLLTHYKHIGTNKNFAKQAFGMELITGLTMYVIIQLVSNTGIAFLALAWMVAFVAIIFDALVKDSMSKDIPVATNHTVTNNPTGFVRRKGLV